MTSDPYPAAQEALFNIMRAWVKGELRTEHDHERVAYDCLQIMKEVNETPGAPFIFIAELARICVEFIGKYVAALNEELPSRDDLLREIDVLEWEYIQESVLLEEGNEWSDN